MWVRWSEKMATLILDSDSASTLFISNGINQTNYAVLCDFRSSKCGGVQTFSRVKKVEKPWKKLSFTAKKHHLSICSYMNSDLVHTAKKENKSNLTQRALNTWRGRLQHFLQLLYNQKIQKVILIWFVHLLKSNKFSEFHRCGSKNVPATPIFILNFPRAWQSF